MRVSFGSLASQGRMLFSDGYRTKGSERASAGFRILRAGDIQNGQPIFDSPDYVHYGLASVIGGKTVQAGDVVLTTKGTVGRTALVKKVPDTPAVYSPQLCFFRTDSRVLLPKYLYFWFSSPEFRHQSSSLQSSTDMAPYISLSQLNGVTITLPPPNAQQAVAEVLGALDDKIATNGKLAVTCETLMRESVIAMALDAQLSDLVTVAKEQVSVSVMAKMTVDHYSLPAFDERQLPQQEAGAGIRSNKNCLAGASVLLSKLNPRFPRVWNVPRPGRNAVASTEFLVLRPFDLPSAAVWALLATSRTTAYLVEHAAGTSGSHQRVRPADALRIPMPSRAQLSDRMIDQLVGLGDRALLAREESQKLAQLRDTLLPVLMDGRLRVRDAIEQVEGEL